MGDSNAAVEDYKSSLADLKFNSKPLINMLTMLAEENAQYAQLIVQAIENHLQQVEASKKLPAFYLMDSINKNLPESTNYKKLFAQNIVSVFVAVFEKVDEKTRQSLYKLRQTWNDIFPQKKLYALDVRVNQIDPAWPITASPPRDGLASIHVNPKFLKQTSGIETENNASSRRSSADDHPQFSPPSFSPHSPEDEQKQLQQQLLQKQQELVRLQQERLEVELAAAKAKLETQTKLLQQQGSATQQSSKSSSDRAALPSAGGTHHNTSSKSGKRSRDDDDERTKHSSDGRSRSSRQGTKDNSPSSKHSRISDRRAASAKDITPTCDIVGKIIGHSSTSRSRSPGDDPRKRSDSPFATPAIKKRRGDEAADNEFGMSHLRSRSDSNVSDPSSPAHNNRWAVFKKERPEEFPIAQSPLLKTPSILPDRRRPHLLPSNSDDRDALTNGGDSLQNRLRDLVMQAEKDVSIGRISEKEYTKVMSSLQGLLAMHDDDSTNDASTGMLRADPRLRRGTGGVPADKTVLWSMAGQVENGSKLPNAYGSPMGRIPRRNKTLLPDVPPPPRPPLLSLDLGQQNAHGQLPMTLYDPEMDERWAARAKKLSEPTISYEFVINDRSFSIGMTGPATARRVKFDSHVINVEVNPNTGELFFNGEFCYHIGSIPRQHFFGGDHLTVYFQGPVKKMWFDREEYILRIDGPPERLILAGHDVDIRLDSKLDSVLVNGKPLCPLLDGATHIVTMWGEQHEVTFVAPLKDIAINGEVCTLDASGPYPVVLIKGEAHGICFKGPDRIVVINGAKWIVPTRGVRWCKIFGPIGRPCALALGGPGHELIIDDMWYEIKFIGVAKTITIGTRTLSVMLPRPAPEVEILGVVAMKDEDLYPRPSLLPKPLLAWPAEERGEEFMDTSVDVKASFGTRGVPSLMAKDYAQYMTPAGYDQTSQQGAMYNDYSSTYSQQQFDSNAPASMDAGLQSSAPQVNVHDLLAKLVNQGIIGTSATPSSSVKTEVAGATTDDTAMDTDADADEVVLPSDIPDLTEFKSDKLKVKYPSSVQLLYSGTPCATCGIRFRRKQDVAKYREHLDWHFRQNKRGKDELKVAKFRHWYYASGDWVQYEEMGDLEEKSRSHFFETMLASVQQQLQHSYNMATVVQPSSCPAAEGDDTCVMCGEQFEQFWDEEEDEWHLRDAVRIDGKAYHPVCYEDAKDAGANGSMQGDEEAEGDGEEMDKNKLSDAPHVSSSASSEMPQQQSTDSVAAESASALTSLEQGSSSESINSVVPIMIKPQTPPRSELVDVVHTTTVATSADSGVSVKSERTSIAASDIGDSVVGVSDVSNPIGQGHGNGETPLARPEGAANTAAVIKTERTDPVSDDNTHKE